MCLCVCVWQTAAFIVCTLDFVAISRLLHYAFDLWTSARINLLFFFISFFASRMFAEFHFPSAIRCFGVFFIIDHIDWWYPQVSTFFSLTIIWPLRGNPLQDFRSILHARYCAVWCVYSFMAHNKWHAVWSFHCVPLPLSFIHDGNVYDVICRFKHWCKAHTHIYTQKKDNGSYKNRELTFAWIISAATKCLNANGRYQWAMTTITATTAITMK